MKDDGTVMVRAGDPDKEYQAGNFLNALDDLCVTFFQTREIEPAEIVNALNMYAAKLLKENTP